MWGTGPSKPGVQGVGSSRRLGRTRLFISFSPNERKAAGSIPESPAQMQAGETIRSSEKVWHFLIP